MTRTRLAEIKARAEKATEGPWRNTIRRESPLEVAAAIERHHASEVVVNSVGTPSIENVVCWMGPAAVENGDDLLDAAFISAARTDVPTLVAALERVWKLTEDTGHPGAVAQHDLRRALLGEGGAK